MVVLDGTAAERLALPVRREYWSDGQGRHGSRSLMTTRAADRVPYHGHIRSAGRLIIVVRAVQSRRMLTYELIPETGPVSYCLPAIARVQVPQWRREKRSDPERSAARDEERNGP
jgi:hypothetical protein